MADDKLEGESPIEGLGRAYESAAPDPRMEERVVSELTRRGLIRPVMRGRRWPIGIAASLLIAFGAGWGAARWTTTRMPVSARSDASPNRWVMLLYQGDSRPTIQLADFRDWAAEAKDSGVVIKGERLENGGWAVSWANPAGHWSDTTAVSGYFVVQASDYEKALRVARTCPYVKNGGKVELRKIVPS